MAMPPEERTLRADAERNRRRLLDAAQALFRDRGLEVSITEIAQAAQVGRGTLFRNFPTKEDLIAAIVVDRMNEAATRGRELLSASDPGQALFELLDDMVGRQHLDRALFDAIADRFLANDDIRAAHAEAVGVLDELLTRAKQAGAVREDVGAVDVLMMFKGVCEAASAFSHVDPGIAQRHLDLVRAAISTGSAQPLRGRAPTLEDIHQVFPEPETDNPAAAAG
jgi:AcrR family transcriptional regulator